MSIQNHNAWFRITLFFVIIVDTIGVGFFWPLFAPLFTSDSTAIFTSNVSLGMRDLLYGITMGIFSVTAFFGGPILGDLSDNIGRKKVMLICLYGTSLGILICLFAIIFKEVFLIIVGRAWLGFLSGSVATAQAAIIDLSDEQSKPKNISLISLANNLGLVLGPMIGGLLINPSLVSWFNIKTPFLFAALLAFCNGTLLIFTFKETFKPVSAINLKIGKGLNIFHQALEHKKISKLVIVATLFSIAWATYFQANILTLTQVYNLTGTGIGHFLSWWGLLFALSLLVIVRIALKFLSLMRMLRVALIVAFLGIILNDVLVMFRGSILILFLTAIPPIIGAAMFQISGISLISNNAAETEQGWAMGIISAVSAISWASGCLFAGVFGAISLHFCYGIAAFLVLCSVISSFILL